MKTLAELPQDLLEAILLRLPVQSLLRFESVSKGWCCLIRSHRFARRHHGANLKIMVTCALKEKGDSTTELTHYVDGSMPPSAEEAQPQYVDGSMSPSAEEAQPQYVDGSMPPSAEEAQPQYVDGSMPPSAEEAQQGPRFVSVPYDTCLLQLTAGDVRVEVVGFPFDYRYEQSLYNTCDGLFIVMDYTDHSLNICNPSNGGWKQLPEGPKDQSLNDTWLDCGIGYDHITEDYKVLRFESDDIKHGHVEVSVYTLSTNSWRRLSDIPYTPCKTPQTMTVVGNALHLFVNRTSGLDDSDLIVSFNLSTEEFREVPQPDYGDRVFQTYLVASDSGLCVAAILDNPRETHIWEMQQYGVEESWTNLMTVASENVYALHLSINDQLLLHAFKGGVSELVFFCLRQDDNGKFHIKTHGIKSALPEHNSIQVYVENPLIRL